MKFFHLQFTNLDSVTPREGKISHRNCAVFTDEALLEESEYEHEVRMESFKKSYSELRTTI